MAHTLEVHAILRRIGGAALVLLLVLTACSEKMMPAGSAK